jgi:hypothetical protein
MLVMNQWGHGQAGGTRQQRTRARYTSSFFTSCEQYTRQGLEFNVEFLCVIAAMARLVARDSSARVRATSPFFTSCEQ